MTRKFAALVLLLALTIFPAIGCGVAATEPENRRTVMRVADFDAKMLVDDIGVLTQTHRPMRTSRYVIP